MISPRETFDRQLAELKKEILDLGRMVEEAITAAVEALKARDVAWAERIAAGDAQINEQRFKIEELCFTLIATQQPAARDLRNIISALSIVAELERMGDHAAGIAVIVVRMGQEPLLKPLVDIPRMAHKTKEMLGQSLEAYVRGDVALAEKVGQEDDEIDALYHQVYRELLGFMIQDPKTVNRATSLLWIAHNLERIADRVTNVAERVIFMATGVMREFGAMTRAQDDEEHEVPGG